MNFKQFMVEKTNETELELNEVKFSEKNLERVVELYSSLMGKQMGGKFKKIGLEDYKRKMGPGKGFRVMNSSGEMLRFNWDQKLAKKAQYDLTSIDFWAKGNIDFQKPTRTVKFGSELNVIQVLSKIIDALKTGTIAEATELIDEANTFLFEKGRTKDEKIEWLEQNGLKRSKAGSVKNMQMAAAEAGLSDVLEVFLGQPESNSFEGELKKVEKVYDQTVYANPDTVFDDIEDLLGLVATKKWRTLIVCGQGGIGKTYHITEGPKSLPKILGPEGKLWTYHSGTKAAPFSFYKVLFQERDKVIVFDEADSLLKNKDIQMMLKPILDTSGNNMAEYMSNTENMVGKTMDEIEEYSEYVTNFLQGGLGNDLDDDGNEEEEEDKSAAAGMKAPKLPSKFKFSGGMIFISNMKAKEIEGAIMSRSIFIDVYLAATDKLKRIESIGRAQAKNDPDTTDANVDELMEALGAGTTAPDNDIQYMTPEYARKNKEITVRAYSLANIMRKSGLPNWANLAALYA